MARHLKLWPDLDMWLHVEALEAKSHQGDKEAEIVLGRLADQYLAEIK